MGLCLSNPRVFDDGTLAFPDRGTPPPIREGYYRDPGNPYVLKPVMPDCPLRAEGWLQRSCGSCPKIVFMICEKGHPITGLECQGCVASGRQAAYLVQLNDLKGKLAPDQTQDSKL